MSSLTDFLFEGKAPPNVTTTGSSVTQLPQFLQDYTQGLIAKAAMQGMEGYQTYGGPRIAPFNADQQGSFNAVRQNLGAYQPSLGAAGTALGRAGSSSAFGAAQPYVSNASKSLPEGIQNYLNPYTENVTNRARDLALRSWNEDVMPSISDIFVRNGTYASSNMADKLLRGGRDVTEGLQSQANASLADAYNNAGNQFNQDQTRQAALAQLVGSLSGQDASKDLNVGKSYQDIASLIQSLGLKDAASLEAVGNEEQGQTQKNLDLAYQDFQGQRDFPWEQLTKMGGILTGMPNQSSITKTDTGPLPGAQYGASGLAQIGSTVGGVKGIIDLLKGLGG